MFVERLLPSARTRLVRVGNHTPLIEAACLFNSSTDLVVVCCSEGRLTGVITKTDVIAQFGKYREASFSRTATSIMTPQVVSCRASDRLQQVWETMKTRRVKNVPVTDNGNRPIGVLTAKETLQAILDEVEDEEVLLREYVMGVGYH